MNSASRKVRHSGQSRTESKYRVRWRIENRTPESVGERLIITKEGLRKGHDTNSEDPKPLPGRKIRIGLHKWVPRKIAIDFLLLNSMM